MYPKLFTFVLLLCIHFTASYAQKELWGEMSTPSSLTYQKGTIVKTDSNGNNLSIIHVFTGPDGRSMNSSLMQASNGKIYGITFLGGANNYGVLFEYDLVIDSFRVLVDFGIVQNPVNGLIEGSPGMLYGTCGATAGSGLTEYGAQIYTYNIATNTMTVVASLPAFATGLSTEGNYIKGNLYKASDGYIYGTTGRYSACPSGFPDGGTVIRINPATNAYTYIYPFNCDPSTGYNPNGGFVETAGVLYSTDVQGGDSLGGVIFAYNISANSYTKQMNLDVHTGDAPATSMVKAGSGKLYGYDYYPYSSSTHYRTQTLYEYDPATNIYNHAHDFYNGDDTGGDLSGLMQASNGKLYGSTERGVYEFDPIAHNLHISSPFFQGYFQSFIEVCRKPVYKYYSNTSDTICQSGAFAFDLHNTNAQTFVWTHNGVADPAQTSGILQFTSAAVTDSGTWVCTLTNQCGVTVPPAIHIEVEPHPAGITITGASSLCAGSTITLSGSIPGGTWYSSNSTIATINSGGLVTGEIAGADTIIYSIANGCGIAADTISLTVNPLPFAGTITGSAVVCASSTTALTNATTGGVWSSNVTGIATVSSTGVVAGIMADTTSVFYTVTNSCGTTIAAKVVTVNSLPVAGTIAGAGTLCAGATIVLTDITTGGAWSSGATGIAVVSGGGIVSGIGEGTSVISYSVNNSCGSVTATATITVNPTPAAGTITGTGTVCAGDATTLSDAATGGTWSSSNIGIATVSSSGVVSGASLGTATISYSVSNGCGTAVVILPITVNPLPVAGVITGAAAVCAGSTIALGDAVTGGVWSSANTLATVSSGIVSGALPGADTILYAVTNSCGTATATQTITINPLPDAGTITGASNVCKDSAITLADISFGGTWTASNTKVTVSAGGMVTGISAGTDTVVYTVTNICGADTVAWMLHIIDCRLGVPVASSSVNGLNVYPNPNKGIFTVNILSDHDEPVSILVTDMAGKKVKEFTGNTNAQILLKLNVIPGVYFLKSTTMHGSYNNEIVIE